MLELKKKYHHKSPIFLEDVDIEKVLVFFKYVFSEWIFQEALKKLNKNIKKNEKRNENEIF